MPDAVRINYLFHLYIQNKSTEAEIIELFDLLKEVNSPDQLDSELQSLWININEGEVQNEPNWKRIYQQVTDTELPVSSGNKVRRISNRWYFAAATAFIGILSAVLFAVFYRSSQKENLTYITYSVPNRSTHTIILADGSEVKLNANTTIRYPKYFTGKAREVSIDGEAYFKVVHLKDKPFIVHSGKLQTQVLGTSFNVDAYSKAGKMKVTVVSGKVAVREAASGQQFMLEKNEQVVLTGSTNLFKKSVVNDTENVIAWQDGKLIFEDASLEEIVAQLSIKFGVKTTLSNPKLNNCHISAVFQNKPLKEILDVITKLTGSGYTLKDNAAVIFGKGCDTKQ